MHTSPSISGMSSSEPQAEARTTAGAQYQQSSTEVLDRFVLRARRVAAHSLAQSREKLEAYARGLFQAKIDLANNVTISTNLPDEEMFESLVARLRPITVKREPIFYETVLDALGQVLSDDDEAERQHLEELRRRWRRTEIQGTQTQGYTVQAINGQMPTSVVTDTQLAAGWLYADLVHADPTGPKADALEHSFRDRFGAAVCVFSQIAVLTLSTLDLIKELQRQSKLQVSAASWDDPVVIGDEEAPLMSRVYRAPLGTAVPSITDSAVGQHGDWNELTLTELLREDPRNRASVTLRFGDEAQIVEAAVLGRRKSESRLDYDVFIDGCVIFTFTFTLEASKTVSCQLSGQRYLDLANVIKLRSVRFLLQAHDADSIAIDLTDGEPITLSLEPVAEEARREYEALEEAFDDVVAIESITGIPIPACNEPFDTIGRVRLRQTRLLWEGRAVRTRLASARVTVPSGEPPTQVAIEAGTIEFAGQRIPTPMTIAFHPELTAAPVDPEGAAGKPRDYVVSAPDGDFLIAWAPDRVDLPESRQVSISAWGMKGVDEGQFLTR